MERWIELAKDHPYLVLISVAALVAMAVVAGLAEQANVITLLLLWGACFLVLLIVGLIVNAVFTRREGPLRHLGVDICVSRDCYNKIRSRLFKKANHIALHSIYAGLRAGGLDVLIEDALLEEEKTVQILIADPSSGHAQGAGRLQLALMSSDTPEKIKSDLDVLRRIERKRQSLGWKGHLDVKIYKDQPMWCIYIFDNELFAAPYLYRAEGGGTICIHARLKEPGPSAYTQFKLHYDKLWGEAVEFNLHAEVD